MKTECASNLHQIGLALHQYASDNDGDYPPEASDDEIALDCIGCTLGFDDIYNKVSAEPKVRLVMDEPR